MLQDQNTLNFIEKAKAIHGEKYDYSFVDYIKNSSKIRIVCLAHGMWEQTPANHLTGYGCKECGILQRAKLKTATAKDNFQKKAHLKHQNKYDYSMVEYLSGKKKVKIICPIHGIFEQAPSNHLYGFGCSKCGDESSSSKQKMGYESFLKKAKKKFGDSIQFIFTEEYKNNNTKVYINCNIHGKSKSKRSIASILVSSYGCVKCGHNGIGLKLSSNIDEFIAKARYVHGNKYNYSLGSYKRNSIDIEIICPTHGIFKQTPAKHISGSGCNKCGITSMVEKQKISEEEFLSRFKKSHTIDYDYSKVIHSGWDEDIKIICPIHGEFKQRFSVHVRGGDCPKCQASKGEKAIQMWLDEHGINYVGQANVKKYFKDSLLATGMEKTSFDFLINDHRLIIEYDGEDHYHITTRAKTMQKNYERFLDRISKDEKKDELAISFNYAVARIPYWELKNIPNILSCLFSGKHLNKSILSRYSLKPNRLYYEIEILSGLPSENDEDF